MKRGFNYRQAAAPLIAALILFLTAPFSRGAGNRDIYDGWRFSLYHGQWTKTTFLDIVLRQKTDFRSSWLTSAGATRKLFDIGELLYFEGEFNIGKHAGLQDHIEVSSLVTLRWTRFLWDRYLETSLACGSGLSYAFTAPPIEERPHNPDPASLLKYLMLEFETFIQRSEDWSIFMRIHHRSGVFGLIKDRQGSNIIGFGVRGRF